jgi:hypothetical protein
MLHTCWTKNILIVQNYYACTNPPYPFSSDSDCFKAYCLLFQCASCYVTFAHCFLYMSSFLGHVNWMKLSNYKSRAGVQLLWPVLLFTF